ncbi:MAG: BspA family leucine-rich repeat surface protein [Firmicutes bacterium]|nr:BspA family leucine-rich repeat surface protein [Bacillota bacterium]
MKRKYVKTLIVVAALLILSLVTSASYAFYVAYVHGNENANNTVITTGDMQLFFQDGGVITLDNAYPTKSVEKYFGIVNAGDLPATYDLYLSEIINNFADKNDLVYTIESVTLDPEFQFLPSEQGCDVTTQTVVPSQVGDSSRIVSSCPIGVGKQHAYKITFTFKDDGTNQDDNKGKGFRAKISVNEYKEAEQIALLEAGPSFNNHIKSLAGTLPGSDPLTDFTNEYHHPQWNNTPDMESRGADALTATKDNNIKHFIVSTTAPSASDNAINVNSPISYYDIKAWYKNNTIYLYTTADKIYLNENAAFTFSGLQELIDLDLTKFDSSRAFDLSYLFSEDYKIKSIDLSLFDTTNAVDTSRMFYEAKSLQSLDISSFDTRNVSNMRQMFKGLRTAKTLNLGDNFYTSKVTNMYQLFQTLRGIETLDLGSHFDVSNVIDARDMFQVSGETSIFKTIYSTQDLIFSSADSTSYIFWGNPELKGGYGTSYSLAKSHGDYAVIDCGTKRPGYLTFNGTEEEYEQFCSQFD